MRKNELRLITIPVANTEYVTVAVAAGIAGIGQRGIQVAIQRGKLPAIALGHNWLIRADDAREYKRLHAHKPKLARCDWRVIGRESQFGGIDDTIGYLDYQPDDMPPL